MTRALPLLAALALVGCPAPPAPSKTQAPPSPALTPAPTPPPAPRIEFSFVAPKPGLSLDEAKQVEVVVQAHNPGPQEVLLFPFFEVTLEDAQGHPVDTTQNMGRWGGHPGGCFLAAETFQVVPPGQTHEFRQPLKFFMTKGSVTGWKIERPGSYTFSFRYRYSRATYRAGCRDGCANHDDPTQPWNRAFEADQTFQGTLQIGQ